MEFRSATSHGISNWLLRSAKGKKTLASFDQDVSRNIQYRDEATHHRPMSLLSLLFTYCYKKWASGLLPLRMRATAKVIPLNFDSAIIPGIREPAQTILYLSVDPVGGLAFPMLFGLLQAPPDAHPLCAPE